jgi:TolB-like protein
MVFAAGGVLIILMLSYFLYSKLSPDVTIIETQETSLDKSVIVLPFSNLSSDLEQDYFSDGMMEEIINHLVKIQDLKVVSRSTAMQYKGTSKTTQEIANELGVATVLVGSVRKEGDQVRISVQLIEGTSDIYLFSESYDRQLTSIFQVQSDVAQLVANSLKAQISPEVKLRIEGIPTENTRAYELYLKGREQYSLFWSEWDISLTNKGIEYYNQAIALDPKFSNALCWSGSKLLDACPLFTGLRSHSMGFIEG